MSEHATSSRQILTALLLLWLAGNGLRLTILAVPPVIPLIHDDLHMSETQVGILTGLPSMLFALAAVPGSLLIARTGVVAALVVGLTLTALGGALRGTINDVLWLYAMTIVTGAGVAIMQVSLPPAVRAWVPPRRIAFATAIYSNGLLVGEILPVALMLPLVMPLAGTWQWGFAVWSALVAVIAILVLLLAPRNNTAGAAQTGRRWWPDWHDPLIWRLGIIVGTVNSMYFATNAFMPDFLTATGHRELISASLTALNVGQLPASFLLLAFASRLQLRVWPFIVGGLLSVVATAGIVFTSGYWIVASATLMGFAVAGVFVLTLALPPLLAPPDDVHRVTAAMFTISYTLAVIVPVVSGLLWDVTGLPAVAFVPVAVCALMLMALAPAISHVKPYRSS